MWRCLGLHDQLRADIAVKNAKGFFYFLKVGHSVGGVLILVFFLCVLNIILVGWIKGENFQVIANLAFLFPAAGMIGLSFLLTPELQVL